MTLFSLALGGRLVTFFLPVPPTTPRGLQLLEHSHAHVFGGTRSPGGVCVCGLDGFGLCAGCPGVEAGCRGGVGGDVTVLVVFTIVVLRFMGDNLGVHGELHQEPHDRSYPEATNMIDTGYPTFTKRDGPDLQKLVEAYHGYKRITPEAWERFDKQRRWWTTWVRDGGLHASVPPVEGKDERVNYHWGQSQRRRRCAAATL